MPPVRPLGVVASLALILLLPVTGCATELGPGPAGPATALTLPAAPRTSSDDGTTGSPAAPPAADGDVAACFDGDCTVRVPDGTTIRVDPRFEVEGVRVSVAGGRGRLVMDTGVGTNSAGGIGSRVVYDDLAVRLLAVEGDRVVVGFDAD